MRALEREIDGLDDALVARVVDQLCALEPEATAVLLTGSYAKGTAAVASDLDLVAITPSPRLGYRTWFEEQIANAPLHVSAAATTADAWVAKTTTPARWSLGFPAINATAYLCTDEETRTRLGADPSLHHPVGDPELEDFLDFVLKAKRAAKLGDELGLRWFAQGAAALAPALLIPVNVERIVCDRRDALHAALKLGVAPTNYAADLTVCLGLTSVSGAEVKAAVARLASDVLAFLRERAPDVDDQPEIARFLADGTLESHLGLIE
jgi:nucleotidyltransferase-like protein